MVDVRTGRWRALAILTLARTAMAFQFQSVAAVQPQLTGAQGFSYAFYGWLLGLYLFPGIVAAFAGGWFGQRFGERRVILWGLAVMVAGGLWLAVASAPAGMLVARAFSGTGAIALNVLVTKMVADWFKGSDSLVPMGVIVTAWPVGLALAMVLLVPLGETSAPRAVHLAAAVPAAVSVACLLFAYPAGSSAQGEAAGGGLLRRSEVLLAVIAGLVWSLLNVALIVVLSFGPDAFAARGATPVEAAAAFSLTGWAVSAATMPGALVTRSIVRRGAMLVTGLTGTAILTVSLIPAGPGIAGSILAALVGFGIGFTAPLVMWLPTTIAPPGRLAPAYGVYFSVYYLGMAFLPPAVGALRDASGMASLPVGLAAVMLVGSAAAYLGFAVLQRVR